MAFYSVALKWWLIMVLVVNTILLNGVIAITSSFDNIFGDDFWVTWAAAAGIFAFIAAMLMRQWFPFVRTAQRVFNVFDWKNASSIDLVKTTRQQRKPDDPPELGVYYFKY